MIMIIIIGPCQRAKKSVKHKNDSDTNHRQSPWNISGEPGKETRRTRD